MSLVKAADYIAQFLVDRGVRDVFAISGASDLRILDAIHRHPELRYICPHHEQAGVMASLTYHRTSGRPAVMLVTAGPGATNTITGVANAFLDSIPAVILAGQEKSEYTDPTNQLRGKGVQGLDMVAIVRPVVKYAASVRHVSELRYHLERAFHEANSGRPGPSWLDIAQDVQAASIDPETLQGYTPPPPVDTVDYAGLAKKTLALIRSARRPLLWVGHGIRLAGAVDTLHRVLGKLGVPALASWQAADLVTDDHPLFAGRAGTYGQRSANFVLQNCDLLIGLGTRFAIPQRGYVESEFARAAKKVVVEIDPWELKKWETPPDVVVPGDVGRFLAALEAAMGSGPAVGDLIPWLDRIRQWRERYPMVLPEFRSPPKGTIHSYHFVDRLSEALTPNDVVCTDMGTSLTCTHAAIRLKRGQRLVTSTGLGEMGFGLPGAIGAALGSKRRTVFIGGEGSLMMNLQELQTLVHHQLPIKMFLLNNNGYLTIKHTEKALFGERESGCGPSSGVSFPDMERVIQAFGIPCRRLDDVTQLDAVIASVLAAEGPQLCNVMMPEDQLLAPKSAIKVRSDGSIYSPPLEDLFPFLPRAELAENMLIPLLEE